MNGFAIINKGVGASSSDITIKSRNALSKALGEKVKCGHMGTLDPMAEGVLLIAFGNVTRLFDFLLSKQKRYTATFTFGEERDTADREGQVVASSPLPRFSDLQEVLPSFLGDIMQVPPKYSAVNVCGRRAYDLARAGKSFELKAKQVRIDEIVILDKTLKGDFCQDVTLSIACGGGTYIRSICTDIAKSLGVCAYMSALTRTQCGGFGIGDSVALDEFLKNPTRHVRNAKSLIEKIMPVVQPDFESYFNIKNGRTADCELDGGTYAFEYNGDVCFIVEVADKKAKSICFLQEAVNSI